MRRLIARSRSSRRDGTGNFLVDGATDARDDEALGSQREPPPDVETDHDRFAVGGDEDRRARQARPASTRMRKDGACVGCIDARRAAWK